MINGVHLLNFGNHRDTRMAFGRFNALVGQNGAGKSTVFRALLAYRDILNGSPTGPRELPRWYLRSGAYTGVIAVGQHEFDDATFSDVTWGAHITISSYVPATSDSFLGVEERYDWLDGTLSERGIAWFPRVLPLRQDENTILGDLRAELEEKGETSWLGTGGDSGIPASLRALGQNCFYFKYCSS